MSFKSKREGRRPTIADCADAMAETDLSLLRLTLAVKKGDYLIAKRLRELANFDKPWYKKKWPPLWPTYLITPVFRYLMGRMGTDLCMAFIDSARGFIVLILWILMGALVLFLIYAILLA